MGDYIVRATAANNQIRAFAATTKNTVETARASHNTSPVATAALGRLLTAGSMMGVMMKGEKDILTLQVKAGGPLNGITVTADSHGNVKGYVGNPNVILHANDKGKLDVAGAVGVGFMNVIKDMGLKEPYVGQTVLQTSEIAEDLTYYFATSEQVPSSVGLGVLMEKDNTVRQAGGFIIQLMPFTEESVISKLEENLKKVTSVTALLEEGHTPESLLEVLLEGFDIEINEKIPTQFYCNCCKERVEKALISVGKKEIQDMIREGKEIELNCHFCNKNYIFTVEELKDILKRCKRA
ncbi:MAG: Hsp33 family molecular chaperone HslO [Blautia sp.]